MKPWQALFNSAGGLTYHAAAFRNRKTLWAPFVAEVATWIGGWAPRANRVLLVGPSAGYTITAPWLGRFDEIVCLEPDPLARWLFRRRFPLARARFISAEVGALPDVIARHPHHAILFCNFLGQLVVLEKGGAAALARRADLKRRLAEALEGREWASYHDVLSTFATPVRRAPFELAEGPLAPLEFARRGLETLAGDGVVRITDHETDWLSLRRPTRFAWWEIRPGRHHLIGFTRSDETFAPAPHPSASGPKRPSSSAWRASPTR